MHQSDWDMEGDSGGGGEGLSTLQVPALKAHPRQLHTQTHRLWVKQPAAWSMAWGCLGSQGRSREALTPSSCPQPRSCLWLCRSSCHPPPKRIRGRGGPERGGAAPGHRACWRRRSGGGALRTLHWRARSGTPGTHRHTLCLTPLTTQRYWLSHPWRCPPDFPREAITPPLSRKSWVSGAHLPHSTDAGRRFL